MMNSMDVEDLADPAEVPAVLEADVLIFNKRLIPITPPDRLQNLFNFASVRRIIVESGQLLFVSDIFHTFVVCIIRGG